MECSIQNKSNNSFYLAGIVPVSGQPLDFNLPWHDAMMPIAPNYLAVERAVVECAYAGCETIWIVCNDDIQPLIRHRLGDYIQDPIWMGRKYDMLPRESRKEIPIFYVPIHPKDRDRRDCLSWSILYGANSAHFVSKKISKWILPDRFYVAFPYGIYVPQILRQHRPTISSHRGFFLSSGGRTVRDGEYLGFTFGVDSYKQCRDIIRSGIGEWISPAGKGIPTEKHPKEKRWEARHFSLDKIFGCVNIEGAVIEMLPWYCRIDNWEGYCEYLGFSNERKEIKRPNKYILSYRELNSIGVDNE